MYSSIHVHNKNIKMKGANVRQENMFSPPKSISDQVYEVLKERILLGKISQGERLIESVIAEEVKTSRTPVREAFQRLVQEGLVERVPQGGVRVTVITPQMIKEVYGIRGVLEVYAVELACENNDLETLNKLKEMSKQARKILSSPEANQPKGWIELWRINTLFHETICKASGSECLVKVLNQLKDLVMRFRFLSLRKTRIRAWDEHDLMIKYFESKDKLKLKELMKAHVELATSDALKSLESDVWEKDV